MKEIKYIDPKVFSSKDAWDDLSLEEKSSIIKVGVENGMTKLNDIRKAYNEFAEGGELEDEDPYPIDSAFMATRPSPLDVATRAALNYSAREFGHTPARIKEEAKAAVKARTAPIDWDEVKRRQAFMETGFKDNTVSRAGAKGRYQIMPTTAAEYTKKTGETGDLADPAFNERVRDFYMDSLLDRSWINNEESADSIIAGKAFAAYNYGPTNTYRALNKAKASGVDINNTFDWLSYMPQETRNYVNFVLRNQDINKHKNNAEYSKALEKENKKKAYGGLLPFNLHQLG